MGLLGRDKEPAKSESRKLRGGEGRARILAGSIRRGAAIEAGHNRHSNSSSQPRVEIRARLTLFRGFSGLCGPNPEQKQEHGEAGSALVLRRLAGPAEGERLPALRRRAGLEDPQPAREEGCEEQRESGREDSASGLNGQALRGRVIALHSTSTAPDRGWFPSGSEELDSSSAGESGEPRDGKWREDSTGVLGGLSRGRSSTLTGLAHRLYAPCQFSRRGAKLRAVAGHPDSFPRGSWEGCVDRLPASVLLEFPAGGPLCRACLSALRLSATDGS